MNLKNLLLIFFTLIISNCIAQDEIKIGIKSGANLAGFRTGNGANTDNIGLSIGGIAELKLNKSFSLQAELLYDRKGGLVYVNSSDFYSIDTKLDYINLPVLIKLYFLKNLSLDFGPQIGFLVNSKGEITNSQGNNEKEVEFNNTNNIDFSLNAGFSYIFNDKIFLQAKYSYGLTKIFKDRRYKNSLVNLSIGYIFN